MFGCTIPTSALGAPKHRSVWVSYLNFSIYATSVGLALSYNHCLISILFADVLVNTAIPTSNIIFVNVFYLLLYINVQPTVFLIFVSRTFL